MNDCLAKQRFNVLSRLQVKRSLTQRKTTTKSTEEVRTILILIILVIQGPVARKPINANSLNRGFRFSSQLFKSKLKLKGKNTFDKSPFIKAFNYLSRIEIDAINPGLA